METEDEFIRSILQEEQRAKEQNKKRKAHECRDHTCLPSYCRMFLAWRKSKGCLIEHCAFSHLMAITDESKKKERKGKTLDEWEREEGGPIQESQVATAHTKRVSRRAEAGGAAADTRILGVKDLEKAEQDLTVTEEDGIKIEPFNLKVITEGRRRVRKMV